MGPGMAIPWRQIDWINLSVLAGVHTLGATAIVLAVLEPPCWPTLALAAIWGTCCGLAICGGYHRLFAHPTYRGTFLLRAFYLLFGAASVQNSALKWSSDHRRHHTFTDDGPDPYNIRRGFWWAHIGWVLVKEPAPADFSNARDLQADSLVSLQHRFYVPLALGVGIVLPAIIAASWGDALGGLMLAGFLRLALQYHATFSINSMAHYIGKRPYDPKASARDSILTALVTFGEGYHNFHHRFPLDYRNGIRGFHYDPTKWWIWTCERLALARDLKRTPARLIAQARMAAVSALAGPVPAST